ncbi:MAG: ankyrin repeat domain-containing protein [Streptosporangiaceae bacterium]
MATLPAHPSLDQLRHQAKDLLRAAKSGDAAAAAQVAAVSDRPTLSAAQLVVARSYGFPSWPALKAEVQARVDSLDEQAAEFCVASVRDWTGRAARLLAQTPEIAGHSLATALMLGDAARVRDEIARDPAAATRHDLRTGWTPLHAVCASKWHFLDPDRAQGLAATARLLLDAGADLNARINASGRTPLNCATATASSRVGHEAIMRLLLERGAVPQDDDLYLTAFSSDDHRCLRLLLDHTPDVAATAEKALAANLASRLDEAELTALVYAAEAGNEPAVSLMLDLGFPLDVRRDDGATALHAAAYAGSAPVVRLLLGRGADPEAPDGQWESGALEWAVIGSGFRPTTSPHPDWVTTVRILIESGASTEGLSLSPDAQKSGASTEGLSLSPDAQKPPSPEVADLLRTYGVGSH